MGLNYARNSGFFSLKGNMARILYDNMKRLVPKGFATLMAMLFFMIVNGSVLNAQDAEYQLGARAGVGMSTLNGFEHNGLKLGLTVGAFGKYFLTENTSLIADFDYSMDGQQSERWVTELRDDKIKEYRKYRLHYFNIPILYQYYFPDILGLEGGLNFRYCFAGDLKTKVGNDKSWHTYSLNYNGFDMGLIVGVYTENLIPDDNVFISLRAYFGFCDVVKEVGPNKNVSIQVTVGYTLFQK